MASIYNTNPHNSSTSYKKHDFVEDASVNGRYWYAIQDNSNQTPSVANATNWGGNIEVTIDGTTTTEPYFFWSPSYNVSTSHAPKILSIRYGDGYEVRSKDGINNDLLSLSLSFDSRSEKEAAAILHFLHQRGGQDVFYFKTPAPYSMIKKFVCKEFNSAMVFADNYNIRCSLQEVS